MVWRGMQKRHGIMMTKEVAEIRYDGDGRQEKRAKMAADRRDGGDVGQQGHRK